MCCSLEVSDASRCHFFSHHSRQQQRVNAQLTPETCQIIISFEIVAALLIIMMMVLT
jgi:hypothetical protein